MCVSNPVDKNMLAGFSKPFPSTPNFVMTLFPLPFVDDSMADGWWNRHIPAHCMFTENDACKPCTGIQYDPKDARANAALSPSLSFRPPPRKGWMSRKAGFEVEGVISRYYWC